MDKVRTFPGLYLGMLIFLSCSPPTDRTNPYDPRSQNHDSNLLPVVRSVFPPVGESNASLLSAVYAEFNIPIDPATVSSRSFMMVDGQGRQVDGNLACSGNRLSYTPSTLLEPGGFYTVTLAGRLCATNGCPLTNSYSWLFRATTNMAGIYPMVVSHTPASNETNVARTAQITVNFSETMDAVSINDRTFTVTKPSGATVKGTITTSGSVARFVPESLLDYGTTNTVRVAYTVRNAFGRSMAGEFAFSFVVENLILGFTNWIKAADPANYPALNNHALIVFQNKLWLLFGGSISAFYNSNAYSTDDGTNWVSHVTPICRLSLDAFISGGELYITHGGSDDVWSSSDGAIWNLASSMPGFWARAYTRIATLNDAAWFTCGSPDAWNTVSAYKEVWYTYNGTTWLRATADGGFFARLGHGMVSYRNKLWVIGGGIGTNKFNDIWNSDNGTNWGLARAAADFSGRWFFDTAVLNDRLYLFGGESTAGLCSDIWSTSDGTNWSLTLPIAPWGQRKLHRVAIWKNKLWLVAGSGVSGSKNDVWYSD